VITAHNEFTAIGPVWTASIPAKTDLKIYLNVTGKSGESGWILVERGEGKTNTTAANEYFSEVPVLYSGTSYRFKVVLTTTDKTQTPILEKIRFDLINSLGEKTTWKFPLFGKAEAASSIVSRGAWGCPEATSSPSWPPAYSPVKKIVLHHTASQLNPVDPPADLRAIWYYHARTLGWGDIGYNYLVDQNGRVYEGRFGGANVVAGHTLGFNTGSMGIAMLGDFSGTLPTNATRAALTQLIGEKSFEYGLNPVGADWVYKKDDNGADIPGTALYTSTIDAHRTYGQTSCPGQIYNILGTIIPASPDSAVWTS
jgi:hypothetical protein